MADLLNIGMSVSTQAAKRGLHEIQVELEKTGKIAEKASVNLTKGLQGGSGGSGAKSGTLFDSLQQLATDKLKGFDKFGIADKLKGLQGMGGTFGRIGSMLACGGAAVAPYAAAAAIAAAPAVALGYTGYKRAEQGKDYFNKEQGLNNTLSRINKNLGGSGFTKALTKDLLELGMKGKTPIEELTKTAQRLMLAFKGNQSEVRNWTTIIADMSAATGESTDFFSDLIAKAQQFGTVENESLKQLNEKGIPIYEQIGRLLGVSTEQAKKLAEQGKITVEQFKEAAQNAARVSVKGANESAVVKNAQYYEQQLKNLETRLYAETYTKAFDEVETQRAKARFEKETEYFGGANVQTMHEELARLSSGLYDACLLVKDGFGDLLLALGGACADLVAWAASFNDYQEVRAKTSTNRLDATIQGWHGSAKYHGVTLEELARGTESRESVAKLSSEIEELRANIQQAEKHIADSYVEAATRESGQKSIDEAKELLAVLERTLEAKQREIEAERERQRLAQKAKELQIASLTSEAKSANDFVKAWNLQTGSNLSSVEQATNDYNEAKARIRNGQGTEQDANFVSFFKPMLEYIKAENEKAKGRADFELETKARNGDKLAEFQLAFDKTLERMQNLGFTQEQISAWATNEQSQMLKQRELQLLPLTTQQKEVSCKMWNLDYALTRARCFNNWKDTITTYERGAWGQGLALEQTDPAIIQAAQQIQAMRCTNAKLNCQINLFKQEIDAIKKLNITPRAL